MLSPDYDRTKLLNLEAKALKAAEIPRNINWEAPIQLPYWMSKKTYACVVVNLKVGELITAAACRRLARLTKDPLARGFLEIQADEETTHAGLYDRYLELLGEEAEAYESFQRFSEIAEDENYSALETMLIFHVLLENDAISIQKLMAHEFPCPVFQAINKSIARDEARHVSFGKIMIPPLLRELTPEGRKALFAWTKAFWFEISEDLANHYLSGVKSHKTLVKLWLNARWLVQRRRLKSLGF